MTTKLFKHKGEHRIAVYFANNAELIARMKKLDGARWSQTRKVWHLPDTEAYRKQFSIPLMEESMPSQEGVAGIEKFVQFLRSKRYSENTIKTYSEALKSFLVFYRLKNIGELTSDDVIVYNNEFILKIGAQNRF